MLKARFVAQDPAVDLDLSRLVGFRDVVSFAGDDANFIHVMDDLHSKIGEGETPGSPVCGKFGDRP